MIVREASVDELERLAPGAAEFYSSTKFLSGFDMDRFKSLWSGLIGGGIGVIFLLCDEAGEIAGALGGMVYPETYSPAMIATEFFWFVRGESRGGGLKLYRAFEEWARGKGCAQIRMGHMTDLMPEKLLRVYERLGFTHVESVYAKELK